MKTVIQLQKRLRARRGQWPTIATAAGLSYWWLIKLAQGRIAEPGLGKIERLTHQLDQLDVADRARTH